ncbi:expressed unknown protein [Seminavis robusta]|uniref:Uncharacterized protein n=1 Tax=Seminavis robusta TaxID=568900 RepID=A0A9N8HAS0_9STRA|nr:expressed unknown protein [Seminavis robusta]|eukprot:Sro330_g118920.1 n/a (135) ;mRNA; r:33057-33461
MLTTRTQVRNDPEFRSTDASEEYELGSKGEVNGAAVAGGIAGMLLAGPVFGAVAAAGAAYMAASKEGDAGDWARKSGSAMNDLGKSLVKVEKENKLLDKTSRSLVHGAKWVEKKLSSNKSQADAKRETEANLIA